MQRQAGGTAGLQLQAGNTMEGRRNNRNKILCVSIQQLTASKALFQHVPHDADAPLTVHIHEVCCEKRDLHLAGMGDLL